jgi:3-deoxy-D-manno-octulosonic-acid transferase
MRRHAVGMDSMCYLLNAVYGLVLSFLFPWLAVRALMTGRYLQGLLQKLLGVTPGFFSSQKPAVWFHGVSVGEIHLLTTVVNAFRRRHPDWQCVISTTTKTGMAEAVKRFAGLPLIFWPFDFSWAIKRTIRAVRPRLVVLAESELWPNFLRVAGKRNVPVIVINGRMSPRSAARYRKLAWLARPLLFSRVGKFAMQSDGYAQALRNLGVDPKRVTVTGSVKYDGVLGERKNQQTTALAAKLGITERDRVWVAGSTHAPEEEIVLDVFRRLRFKHPELRLILVPRSPDRFDEVARLIDRHSFSFVRKSRLESPPSDQPAVILIDTMGDLNAAWGLADVGFTGGSLDGKRGGQSMIEPAGLGVPVVFGPHVWNFRDAAMRLLEVNAAIRVEGTNAMEHELLRLLDNNELRETMGKSARAMVLAQQGATERTIDEIDEMLGLTLAGQEKNAA